MSCVVVQEPLPDVASLYFGKEDSKILLQLLVRSDLLRT
jgi:hypothetical protein